jgi:hypothetical protein
MKLLIFLLFCSLTAKAQNCPLTSCKDSLPFTAVKDTLILAQGWTVNSWTIENGPLTAVVSGKNVIGLQPGTTTVLTLEAVNGNVKALSTKVITVAPIPRRSKQILYDDGTIQVTP